MKRAFLLTSIAFVLSLTSCNTLVDDSMDSIGGEDRVTRVVVAVFDSNGNAINVQEAEANTEKDYEMVGENFKHRVLIEDFTGTWCVNCPRVTYTIEEILEPEHHDKFVAVALHNGTTDPFAFVPYETELHDILSEKIGALESINPDLISYPFSPLNRVQIWKRDGAQYNAQQVLDLVQESSPVGIRIDSDLGDTEGTVNVSFKFNQDYNETLKYQVYIVEDGLVYPQHDSSGLYGATNNEGQIPDFIHNAVVKGMLGTDIMGTTIPANETKAGQIFNSGRLNVSYKVFD